MPVVLAVFIMFLSCFRISKKSRCRAVSSVYKFISFIYTRPALVLLILHTQKPHPPDETTGYLLLVEMALANSTQSTDDQARSKTIERWHDLMI